MSWSWVMQLRMSRKHKALRDSEMGEGKSKENGCDWRAQSISYFVQLPWNLKSLFSAFRASVSGLQHHEKPVTLIFREFLGQRFSLCRVFA